MLAMLDGNGLLGGLPPTPGELERQAAAQASPALGSAVMQQVPEVLVTPETVPASMPAPPPMAAAPADDWVVPQEAAPMAAAPADDWVVPAEAPQAEPLGLMDRAGLGVRNVLQGAAGMADMLNNAGGALGNLPSVAVNALAGREVLPEPFQYGAVRRAVDAGADAMGLPQAGTAEEKLTGAVVEGASGTLTNIPAGAAAAARMAPGIPRAIAGAFGEGAAVDAIGGAAGGLAQGVAQQEGVGDFGQLSAALGGGTVGGALAGAIIAAVRARRGAGAMARRGTLRPEAPPSNEELAGVLDDMPEDLAALAAANGIQPGDPRLVQLRERLGARREAEAERTAPQPVQSQDGGPLQPPMPPEQVPQPPTGARPVSPAGEVFAPGAQPEIDAARENRAGYGPSNGGLVPTEPQPNRMTPEQITQAQRQMQEPAPGPETPERFTVPEGRAPQTPEQAAEQRQAQGAFDLAQRQRERDSTAPETRDTQTGSATPQGPQRETVLLDQGYPVRVVGVAGEGTVRVQRYDPRSGNPQDGAEPYVVQLRDLREATYTKDPRAAQDFGERAEGPTINRGRARGKPADAALGMPEQTFRVTPDDPQDYGTASSGGPGPTPRAPLPQQPAGEAPGGGGSRSEQRYRTWQEAEEAFRRRQEERAQQEQASGNTRRPESGPYTQETSNSAKVDAESGRYGVDEAGNVRSEKGGAIRFANQKQAAKWILSVAQKDSHDQVFEIANHPSGQGFTARVTGHVEGAGPYQKPGAKPGAAPEPDMLDPEAAWTKRAEEAAARAQNQADTVSDLTRARNVFFDPITGANRLAEPGFKPTPEQEALAKVAERYVDRAAINRAIAVRQQAERAAAGRAKLAGKAVERAATGEPPLFRPTYGDPKLDAPATRAEPTPPQSLSSFLVSRGGLRDTGGDLRHAGANRPGLIRPGGMELDRAVEAAREEGYLHGEEDVPELLAKIREEVSGRPQYRPGDDADHQAAREGWEAEQTELRAIADELGLSPEEARGMSRGQLEDIRAERRSQEAQAEREPARGDFEPGDEVLDRGAPATIVARGEGEMAGRWLVEDADDESRYYAKPEDLTRPGGDMPLYANPVLDPAAWRRLIGEPLGRALEGLAKGTGNAFAHAGALARAITYSADSEARAAPSMKASATYRSIVDDLHATAGEGSGTGRTFDEAVFLGTNKALIRVQAIEDLLAKIGVTGAQLREAVTGGRAKVGEAATQTRELLRDLLQLQRDAGVDVGDAGPRYFPREWDTSAIFKDANAERRFILAATREYQDPAGPGLPHAEARAAADALLQALKRGGQDVPDGHGRGNAGNTKERAFGPGADRRMAEFYVQDSARVLGLYALRAVRRAEIARRFGPPEFSPNGVVLPKLEERIRQAYDEGATTDDLARLRNYAHIATGVGLARSPRPLEWLRTWATVGNLNASLVINLSEALMPAVRSGNLVGALGDVAGTMKVFQRELRKMPRADQALLAERLGIIAGREHNAIMQTRFGAGDIQDRSMARVTERFYRTVGMEQLTSATRAQSTARGVEFIRDMALAALGERKFLGLFGDENRAKFYLRELGVPAGKELEMARFVKENHDAGYPDQLLRSEPGQAWATAVGRFVDQASLRPSAATRPRWASTTYGSLIFNLSSYPYAFGKNVVSRVGRLSREAAGGKGYSPVERAALVAPVLLPLATFAAAQVGLQELRTLANGDPEVEKRKTDARRRQDWVMDSGLAGGAQPWLNLLSGVQDARQGVARTAAGPVIGMPLGLVDALGAAVSPANSDRTNSAERSLAKAGYRAVVEPAANIAASFVPGGRGALGVARGLAGAGALVGTSTPAVRDTFVDGVAGPQTARARRTARRQPIYGLGDTVSEATRDGRPVR